MTLFASRKIKRPVNRDMSPRFQRQQSKFIGKRESRFYARFERVMSVNFLNLLNFFEERMFRTRTVLQRYSPRRYRVSPRYRRKFDDVPF